MLFVAILSAFFSAIAQEEPASFIHKYETNIVIDKNGRQEVKRSYLLQINSRSGLEEAEVSLYFQGGNKPKNISARILSLSGEVIRTLKKKDILTTNYIAGASSFGDTQVMEFDLIHNSYPYLIEYSYTQTYDEFIFVAWWQPNTQRNLVSKNSRLTVEAPKSYQLNFKERNVDTFTREELDEDRVRYVWQEKEAQEIETESYGPDYSELRPQVVIMPENFSYGIAGQSTSWESYGDWIFELGKTCSDFSESQKLEIVKHAFGKTDTLEIIKTLFYQMQDNMRYINVSLDIGGMKPYPASYVAQNNFGDCKALTYYMKSALELFGINSYPVDVHWDEPGIQILKDLPGQQFNHVFLCVPWNGDTLWLENTSSYYPAGYLDMDKRGTQGLLIQEGRSHLIDFPAASNKEVEQNQQITFTLTESNTLKGKLEGTYKGNWYEWLKYLDTQMSSHDQDSWIKDNFMINHAEVSRWEIIDQDRDTPSVNFNAQFQLDNHTKRYGNNKVIQIPPSRLPKLKSPEKRIHPFRLINPIAHHDQIAYQIDPEDKVVLPQDISVESENGSFNVVFSKDEKSVICDRTLILKSNIYEGSSYTDFYEFIQTIRQEERKAIITLKS